MNKSAIYSCAFFLAFAGSVANAKTFTCQVDEINRSPKLPLDRMVVKSEANQWPVVTQITPGNGDSFDDAENILIDETHADGFDGFHSCTLKETTATDTSYSARVNCKQNEDDPQLRVIAEIKINTNGSSVYRSTMYLGSDDPAPRIVRLMNCTLNP